MNFLIFLIFLIFHELPHFDFATQLWLFQAPANFCFDHAAPRQVDRWPKPPSEEVAALSSAKNIDDDFDDDDVSDADERDDDEEISVT